MSYYYRSNIIIHVLLQWKFTVYCLVVPLFSSIYRKSYLFYAFGSSDNSTSIQYGTGSINFFFQFFYSSCYTYFKNYFIALTKLWPSFECWNSHSRHSHKHIYVKGLNARFCASTHIPVYKKYVVFWHLYLCFTLYSKLKLLKTINISL